METLLNIARAIRLWLYDFTSTPIFGVQIDVILHFVIAGAAFFALERRVGSRRAAGIVAGLIVLKEVLDVFLKSQLRYIKSPTPEMLSDIGTDVLMGVVGALCAWLIALTWRARNRGAAAS